MNDAPPCQLLDWDSRFFGFRIARVTGDRMTLEQCARVLTWCRDERVRCCYFLTASDDDETVRAAEASGFHLVDVRVELAWRVAECSAQSLPVRAFTESDLEELRRIAADAYGASRFAMDPSFGAASASRLFEAWIEKSCRGWADAVLVAPHDERAGGFITCHLDSASAGRIGLLGVREKARGAGLARSLVSAAQSFFHAQGIAEVSVATQARNIAAQRLYQACGFRTRTVGLWYHRWFEDSER